ncbi:hypothetical protein [Naumannella huperziae]
MAADHPEHSPAGSDPGTDATPEPARPDPPSTGHPSTGHAEVDAVLAALADIDSAEPGIARERLASAHEALHGIIEGRRPQ